MPGKTGGISRSHSPAPPQAQNASASEKKPARKKHRLLHKLKNAFKKIPRPGRSSGSAQASGVRLLSARSAFPREPGYTHFCGPARPFSYFSPGVYLPPVPHVRIFIAAQPVNLPSPVFLPAGHVTGSVQTAAPQFLQQPLQSLPPVFRFAPPGFLALAPVVTHIRWHSPQPHFSTLYPHRPAVPVTPAPAGSYPGASHPPAAYARSPAQVHSQTRGPGHSSPLTTSPDTAGQTPSSPPVKTATPAAVPHPLSPASRAEKEPVTPPPRHPAASATNFPHKNGRAAVAGARETGAAISSDALPERPVTSAPLSAPNPDVVIAPPAPPPLPERPQSRASATTVPSGTLVKPSAQELTEEIARRRNRKSGSEPDRAGTAAHRYHGTRKADKKPDKSLAGALAEELRKRRGAIAGTDAGKESPDNTDNANVSGSGRHHKFASGSVSSSEAAKVSPAVQSAGSTVTPAPPPPPPLPVEPANKENASKASEAETASWKRVKSAKKSKNKNVRTAPVFKKHRSLQQQLNEEIINFQKQGFHKTAAKKQRQSKEDSEQQTISFGTFLVRSESIENILAKAGQADSKDPQIPGAEDQAEWE